MTLEQTRHAVVVMRVFDAPIVQMWQAWIEPEMVKRWWGPTGFDCSLAEMTFREGGTSQICLRTPEHDSGTFCTSWTYERIVPIEQIAFIQHFTDFEGNRLTPATIGLPSDIPESIQVVITFTSLSKDQTEMTVAEYSYPTKQASERSREGLEQSLDKLAAFFA